MLSKKDFIAYLFRPQIKGHLRIHRIGLEIHREINCDDGIDTHARLIRFYRYICCGITDTCCIHRSVLVAGQLSPIAAKCSMSSSNRNQSFSTNTNSEQLFWITL